ncbi:MAG TPA: hypothetical protein DCE71_01325 [Parachlamydiales bacterium]|nr:hypothetical protein [Parachlamydiales bacterium]
MVSKILKSRTIQEAHSRKLEEQAAQSSKIVSIARNIFPSDLAWLGLIALGVTAIPFTWPKETKVLNGLVFIAFIGSVVALLSYYSQAKRAPQGQEMTDRRIVMNKNPVPSLANGEDEKITICEDSIPQPFSRKEIINTFNDLGNIDAREMALVIAAKQKNDKPHRQSIFVIQKLTAFFKTVKELAISPTKSREICFQFVTRVFGHSVFGEVSIDKSHETTHLKIFIYDPVSPWLTGLTSRAIYKLSSKIPERLKITLLLPKAEEILQKGHGCSYFSLDGAFMLSSKKGSTHIYSSIPTSSNQSFEIVNIDVPVQLKRGCQFFHDECDVVGISSSILNHPENSREIVNLRGHTATESVTKYLKKISPGKIHNLRVEHKRETYQKKVKKFLRQNKITLNADLLRAISPFSQQGFYEYAKSLMNAEKSSDSSTVLN